MDEKIKEELQEDIMNLSVRVMDISFRYGVSEEDVLEYICNSAKDIPKIGGL